MAVFRFLGAALATADSGAQGKRTSAPDAAEGLHRLGFVEDLGRGSQWAAEEGGAEGNVGHCHRVERRSVAE